MNGARAFSDLASNVALVTEARRSLPALRDAATGPAGDQGVMQIIGRRLALFPQTEMSAGALAAWWDDYCDALSGVPECALEAAMKEWIRSPQGKFMPKPCELLELSRQAVCREVQAYARARDFIRFVDAPPALPPIPEMSEEDKQQDFEKRQAMADEIRHSLGIKIPVRGLPVHHGLPKDAA